MWTITFWNWFHASLSVVRNGGSLYSIDGITPQLTAAVSTTYSSILSKYRFSSIQISYFNSSYICRITHTFTAFVHTFDGFCHFGLLSWILLLFVKWINPITYWMYKHVTLCLFLKTVFSVTRRSRSDESCRVTCWVGQRLHWLYWCDPGEWGYL